MKKFRTSKLLASGLVATLVAASFSQVTFAEGESLKQIFTDSDFRACVVTAFQAGVDSLITEDSVLTEDQMTSLTSLTCNSAELTEAKLTGLDQLTGLIFLSLSNNQLTGIDLSSNVALERLLLANNLLTSLDLSANENLTYLDVRGNTSLDVENLDVAGTKLATLTDSDGIWEAETTDDDTTTDETEEPSNETIQEPEPCSSWAMSDENVLVFKQVLAIYGYDTSHYDPQAVKIAALQTNMCDGMSIAEARMLMNAMGVRDLSDAELARIAEIVTKAYNEASGGSSLEEVMSVMSSPTGGILVPNTGVNTGDFNASVIVISLGVIIAGAGVFYGVRYGLKRKEAKVTFRR